MTVLPTTLDGLATLASALLGLDPWRGGWPTGGVPLDVPAGAFVARAWLARRVGLADDARWAPVTVMHNDGWVLFERPGLYHFFGADFLPYAWATRVPGIDPDDPVAALRAACIAAPLVRDEPSASNRPPLEL